MSDLAASYGAPDEYTPTTEQVRWQYTREEPPRVGTVSEKTAEFDRWLAAEKAKWQAEVLREAASEMDDTDDPDAIYVSNGDIDLWLLARADRIERGSDDDR